jgi:hypothetical protein
MSELGKETYLGLPVLTAEEGDLIRALFSEPGELGSTVAEEIVETVIAINTNILYVIEHDLQYFRRYEKPDFYTQEDLENYEEGVHLGYEFVIACFTYMDFLSRDYTCLRANPQPPVM